MTDYRPGREPPPERERQTLIFDRGGSGTMALIGAVVVVLIVIGFVYYWLTGLQPATAPVTSPDVTVDVTPNTPPADQTTAPPPQSAPAANPQTAPAPDNTAPGTSAPGATAPTTQP